jgi:hypothetical protein
MNRVFLLVLSRALVPCAGPAQSKTCHVGRIRAFSTEC